MKRAADPGKVYDSLLESDVRSEVDVIREVREKLIKQQQQKSAVGEQRSETSARRTGGGMGNVYFLCGACVDALLSGNLSGISQESFRNLSGMAERHAQLSLV